MSGPPGGVGYSGPGPGGCGVSGDVGGSCPTGTCRLLAMLMGWPGSSYLGWTRGSPPGVPGGGITGVVPGFGFGAGARMPGSTPAGWTVPGELQGWRFRVEPAPGRVRVFASANGSEPAVWFVPGRRD